MAFTYDTTTDRGRVRLLVGDTDTAVAANQIFDDDEIDAFLSIASNEVFSAAAQACRSIAANAGRSAIAWKANGASVDKKAIPTFFIELANRYEAEAKQGTPSEEIDSLDYRLGDFGEDLSEFVGDIVG